MIAIHRRLGAANLAVARATAPGGPTKADSNRAVDPTGLVWEGQRARPAIGMDGRRFSAIETYALPAAQTGQRPFGDTSRPGARALIVLFLCTGNSARSIMAEAIMNRLGEGRFLALSAGSAPKGDVHDGALGMLARMNHKIDSLRSKSWEEFTGPDRPKIDFVFTLCDSAASEICPIWPGQPMSAHWGLPDPAAVDGPDALVARAFADTYRMLAQRIGTFVSLPIASLDRLSLQRGLDRIGRQT